MRYSNLDAETEIAIREGLEGLTPGRIAMLYRRAPLLRPISDLPRLWAMFEHASLVLTAWNGSHLVGIARVLTDNVLYSYFCDLAVEPDVQGLGIGKRLIQGVLDRCENTEILFRSSQVRYMKQLGLDRAQDAWIMRST